MLLVRLVPELTALKRCIFTLEHKSNNVRYFRREMMQAMPDNEFGDDDKSRIPCCMLDATRKVRQIKVAGHSIGITGLDAAIEIARGFENDGEAAVRRELLRLAGECNYIPPSAEKDYEDSLYAEYLKMRRC